MIEKMRQEAGYSMVEVLAAIVILSLAILPMVSMFDAGLRAATTSGNYDQARSLANANLESVKAMSFSDVETLSSCPRTKPDFACSMSKSNVRLIAVGSGTAKFAPDPSGNENMIKITITVAWGDGKTYGTSGLVAE